MPANVIDMLKEDHKQVDAMFEQVERTPEGERGRVIEEIAHSLETHARIEESVLYPFIRSEVPGGAELMDEAEREHQEAKDAIAALKGMSPDDPGFNDAFASLRDGVRHHVQEEEGEVFPKLAEAAGDDRLVELGRSAAQARTLSLRPDKPAG